MADLIWRVWSLAKRARNKAVIVCIRRPTLRLADVLLKLSLRVHLLGHGTYQPVLIRGRRLNRRDAGRESEKRWEIIRAHLPGECKTAVDLGSGEGFFAFRLAELGITTIGVDNYRPALFVAQQTCIMGDSRGVGFIHEDITPDFVGRMPCVDVVLSLSVFHHLLHFHGVEWCADLLRILRTKIKLLMFFEMGHSAEYTQRRSRTLPDMGPDPENWIRNFLLQQGYSKAEKIGTAFVDSYKNKEMERAIFMVWP